MKYRRIIRYITFCFFLASNSNAQQLSTSGMFSNQEFFKEFPQKIICDVKSLDKLFSMDGQISMQLSPDILLQGKIISHVKQNASAETINISLPAFHDAVFTLSRIKIENGTTQYMGHILHMQGSDAITLEIENKKYYFIKTTQRLVMTE